jgi:hypothetical protein
MARHAATAVMPTALAAGTSKVAFPARERTPSPKGWTSHMAPTPTPKKPTQRPLRLFAIVIGAVAATASFLAPAAQASPQPGATASHTGVPRPTVRTAVLHGSALRTPVLHPAHVRAQGAVAVPFMPGPRSHHPPAAVPHTGAVQVAAQRTGRRPGLAPAVSATILNSFQGTTEHGGIFPPDPTGAAGPSNVVTGSNAQLQIDSRSGGVVRAAESFDQFFGQPSTTFMFDPHIIYDISSGRFMTVIDNGNNLWLAVSRSSDATGSWCMLQFNGPARGIWSAADWADYPLIGTDTNFIYLTANIYSGTRTNSGPFQFTRMLELAKSSVLSCSGAYSFNIWSNLYDPNTGIGGTNVGDQPSFTVSPELDQTPNNPFPAAS